MAMWADISVSKKDFLFIYLQALSNLTGDPYRAQCSADTVPKFKYEQYLQDCGYSLSSAIM